MKSRLPLLTGAIALAAWLVGLMLVPKAALLGWLVAALAFASIPIGCLAVLMMVALVPGTWRRLYTAPLLTGSALLPVAALAMVPLLICVRALYPWADPSVAAGMTTFKAAWLSPGFFIARQLIYWAVLLSLWLALVLLPLARSAIAAAGLIAYAMLASWMGIDLAESLTPHFHSSIYGLLILSGQWLGGVAFGVAVGLQSERGPAPPSAAGALIVALLMWAYLHAMQFIVIWSGDIPAEVVWYVVRGTGGWAWVTGLLFVGQGLLPFFAMLSPDVRSSRTAMTAIALLTLAMRPLESAWLLLPGQGAGWSVWLFALVALVAMAGLGAASVAALRHRRPAWFAGNAWFV